MPEIDPEAMALLFRHKLLRRLLNAGKITHRTIEILDNFRHPGFSVHLGPQIAAEDTQARERTASYLLHAPFSLERMSFEKTEGTIIYQGKCQFGHHAVRLNQGFIEFTPLDFLAAVTSFIPDKGQQLVRYYGFYSNVKRGLRVKISFTPAPELLSPTKDPDDENSSFRKQCKANWARLIRKVYEVDPLVCPKCGTVMSIISFITDPPLVKKILDHLNLWDVPERSPPFESIVAEPVIEYDPEVLHLQTV